MVMKLRGAGGGYLGGKLAESGDQHLAPTAPSTAVSAEKRSRGEIKIFGIFCVAPAPTLPWATTAATPLSAKWRTASVSQCRAIRTLAGVITVQALRVWRSESSALRLSSTGGGGQQVYSCNTVYKLVCVQPTVPLARMI